MKKGKLNWLLWRKFKALVLILLLMNQPINKWVTHWPAWQRGVAENSPCFPSWNPCLFLQRQMDLIKQQCCYVLGLTGSHGLNTCPAYFIPVLSRHFTGNITFVHAGPQLGTAQILTHRERVQQNTRSVEISRKYHRKHRQILQSIRK